MLLWHAGGGRGQGVILCIPIQGRAARKGMAFGPYALTGYIISNESAFISIWTRPLQVMAARLSKAVDPQLFRAKITMVGANSDGVNSIGS